MRFIAYEFTSALDAGLTLCGQDSDGGPEWWGKHEQWRDYHQKLDGVHDCDNFYGEGACTHWSHREVWTD